MVLRLTPDQFSIASRSVLVGFSLGPRSSLVRLSFVSRCLFVSLSKTDREPNEDRTNFEREKDERRSRKWRKTIEDLTGNCPVWWECPPLLLIVFVEPNGQSRTFLWFLCDPWMSLVASQEIFEEIFEKNLWPMARNQSSSEFRRNYIQALAGWKPNVFLSPG